MNETGNERSIRAETVPSVLGMEPKKARRAWAIFIASNEWTASALYVQAESVRFSIDMVILNLGDGAAEDWARKNLAQEFAKFIDLLQ